MKTSCGILLKCGGKYLLGHTTGHKSPESWTILKGMANKGEAQIDAAYREFKEEAGIDLKSLGLPIRELSSYNMKDKRVTVFLCEDDKGLTGGLRPVCESFVRPNYPEIDVFQWATRQEAERMVFASQKHLFQTP